MRSAVGVVLAGGRSRRMGRDKARIEVEGETLLVRQVRVLREGGISRILLSVGGFRPGPFPDAEAVPDEVPGQGPLGGIVAAMARVPDRPLLVLAVDMPGVRPAMVRRLVSVPAPGGGCVPRVEGRWEPLCALYPPGTLPTARKHLEAGSGSPTGLVAELFEAGRVVPLELSGEEGRLLRSWNRPGDVPATRAEAGRRPP